jgi:hypothetical protein
MSKVYAVFDGFVGTETGDVRLSPGDEYDTSHPLVRAQPGLFTAPETPTAPAKKIPPRRK